VQRRAAFLAGLTRTVTGSYFDAFFTAGAVAVVAAFFCLLIGRDRNRYANI